MANSADQDGAMRAMAIDGFGGPEALTLHELPIPKAGAGELLIKVSHAGVGVWDAMMRRGLMEAQAPEGATLPRILGADGSGTVVAVGEGVQGFAEGDQVYAYGFFNPKGGLYAEYAAVPADQAAHVPEGLPMEQAGALAVTGLTALRGLDDTLRIAAGDKVLIFGASGGVGHPAVQLAKAMGAEVLAVVSDEDGAVLAREAGADAAVNSRTEGLAAATRAFAPEGLAGVLAAAHGDGLDAAVALVREGGRVAYPHGVQPEPKGKPGVEAVGYDGAPGREAFDRLNSLIARRPFTVHVSARYALADAAEAHRALEGHHFGRVVLTVP